MKRAGMKVAIRTDSSLKIGTGHVVRCLRLAEALKAWGAEVVFLCRPLEGHLASRIMRQGFPVRLLPEGELDEGADADATLSALDSDVDCVVVDHYGLGAVWERRLRGRARMILVIDDLANREHDCDVLVDQNFSLHSETRYQGLVPAHCRRLVGPRYALLGDEFARCGPARKRSGELKRLLVFFGGVDAGNETGKALEAIRSAGRADLAVDVVIGATNPHRAALEATAATMKGVRCLVDVLDMQALMREADAALGAGGITTWERCRTGLPSITVAIAENQVEASEALAETGTILFLGRSREVTATHLAQALGFLATSPRLARHLSSASAALVDGRGVERVAAELMPNPVTLRKAIAEDCEPIYGWRNDEATRQGSFDSRPIVLEEHRKWFEATLKREDRALLVAETDGRPVGVLRYDFAGDTATVSIYLVPGLSTHGLGRLLLRAGTEWVRQTRPSITRLVAETRPENIASRRAFAAAGYVEKKIFLEANLC